MDLKKKHLILFCTIAWPGCPLEEKWPVEESIDYNIILQLDLFCKKQGKRHEAPYVQAFFALRDNPDLCTDLTLLTTLAPLSWEVLPFLGRIS